MRRLRILPVIWLVLLLTAPLAAWLLGVRQPLLQNHPKALFPALNRSSLLDDKTFGELDAAVLDRLPMRGTALRLHARAAVDLFRDSTNPDVAIGHDGWLYYVPELVSCTPGGAPIADVADGLDLLARTFVAAGYDPIVFAAGSKLLIHTRDAPSLDEERTACERRLERRIEARLRQTPGGFTIDQELRALEQSGQPTFLRWDSHWNWRGRELFVRGVLNRIQPGLADDAGIHIEGTYARSGDLTGLLGLARSEEDRVLAARRAPRRPLPAKSVVLVGDSQFNGAFLGPTPSGASILDLVLPGQRRCDWSELAGGACDNAMRGAHTVLFEKVARDAQFLSLHCWRPLAVAAERLQRGRPGRWQPQLDGQQRSPRRDLTIGSSGTETARVLAPGEDISATPRLLRLPIARFAARGGSTPTPVTMAQVPQQGDAAPCATPSPIGTSDALFLPVPAGRRVSDLVVQVTATPGTRFAAPEEIVLDGHAGARERR